jgi:hypothetical protein
MSPHMFRDIGYRMLRGLYDRLLRPFTPYKIAVYNHVAVTNEARLFDRTEIFPNYKESNISFLRECVSPNDDVVVIGGGVGVTSIVSARMTGKDGEVVVYEASSEQMKKTIENINLNGEDDVCTVEHAVVGELNQSGGHLGNPDEVPVNTLPECNLIEIDCEGAENHILSNLEAHPEHIIVETHPKKGAGTEGIETLLNEKGYKPIGKEADPVDGHVLLARKS